MNVGAMAIGTPRTAAPTERMLAGWTACGAISKPCSGDFFVRRHDGAASRHADHKVID